MARFSFWRLMPSYFQYGFMVVVQWFRWCLQLLKVVLAATVRWEYWWFWQCGEVVVKGGSNEGSCLHWTLGQPQNKCKKRKRWMVKNAIKASTGYLPHKDKKEHKTRTHNSEWEGCRMSFNTKTELLLHKSIQCPVDGYRKKFNSNKYVVNTNAFMMMICFSSVHGRVILCRLMGLGKDWILTSAHWIQENFACFEKVSWDRPWLWS